MEIYHEGPQALPRSRIPTFENKGMSHLQHHHHQQHSQYVHYTGPPVQVINNNANVSSQDTIHQPQQNQQQQQSAGLIPSSSTPLVATGDWTKDLIHLAKTAELKKHALTLQLHTAHILSAHASLQEKSKAIQDIKEQKNKLESERTRLLNSLREVNEDRDKADLMESTIERECHELRTKMNQLSDGEYAIAKSDVDRLRQELGQPPLPSLQNTLDEKASQYLNDRRLNGNETQTNVSAKRGSADLGHTDGQPSAGKRPRGRPKGSKNRSKGAGEGGGIAGAGVML